MGTWLGLTTGGRFSLLTNYREPMSSADPGNFPKTTDAPSRGALTTDFLTGSMSPLEYLQGLPQQDYCGFNLLVGDLQQQQLAYLSNRGTAQPQLLPPGCYGAYVVPLAAVVEHHFSRSSNLAGNSSESRRADSCMAFSNEARNSSDGTT
eukprot:GHRQ01023140.1.p1 GENE.GHRQ01023140.1~~GHRQ01023140.1.p1  ORF type:complete len:150 (+),score=50.10 GHRQ01023140.1:490-939(+)